MQARHPGSASPREPPRACCRGRQARRQRGEASRRPVGTTLRRSLPHLHTPQGSTPTPSRASFSTWTLSTKPWTTSTAIRCGSSAVDTLNRQLRSGVSDDSWPKSSCRCVRRTGSCLTEDIAAEAQEPQIICSLGLFEGGADPAEGAPSDGDKRALSIVTVATGHETTWSRKEIYNDNGR